jgi:hypothetical protein
MPLCFRAHGSALAGSCDSARTAPIESDFLTACRKGCLVNHGEAVLLSCLKTAPPPAALHPAGSIPFGASSQRISTRSFLRRKVASVRRPSFSQHGRLRAAAKSSTAELSQGRERCGCAGAVVEISSKAKRQHRQDFSSETSSFGRRHPSTSAHTAAIVRARVRTKCEVWSC